ncbi:MAG: transporter [Burkholderiales bacterium]
MKHELITLACLWGSAGAALAADYHGLTLGGGVHYTEGNYGTPVSTRVTALAFTGRYDTQRWTFKATVPYLFVSGSASVVPGVGQVRNVPAADSSASGLGDLVFSATHKTYYDPATQLGVDVTGRIKLATADADEGLGTGEHDLGIQAEVFKAFGRVTGFAGLGYTMFGSSRALPLRDVFNATLGATYRIDERDSAGLAYDERDAVARGAARLSELTLFWSRQLDRAWKTQLYFLVGLENGSPDWGAGLSAAYAF